MYGDIGFFTVASTLMTAEFCAVGNTTRAETRLNIDIFRHHTPEDSGVQKPLAKQDNGSHTKDMFLLAAISAMQSGFPAQIESKTKIPKGEYILPSATDDRGASAAVVISGDNMTVDLKGVVLRGGLSTAEPDERSGIGIEIRGKNVTLKNARVHGYKVAVFARNAPGLKILDSDFSYNWKQRLKSTPEKEDLSDWLSYHNNEAGEWLRYGAAIYLENCDRFEVRGNRAVGGQNGLMLTACDDGLVWNNNFSYLSSLGIGMYRSSDNRIMHNRLDYCLRGFSYGVYNRGQDSAGILIYEQSNDNVFAYNSVTHGGDGFFLWAGQETMDSGKGGCNDNLLYGNDFSHAPTNGIEATFSKNTFANNLILECWHGLWGGYSYSSSVIGNLFGYNVESIAIEHGQQNVIQDNAFFRDGTAIKLWMNEKQDPTWGYAKVRDTVSKGYRILDNTFSQHSLGITNSPDGLVDYGAALQLTATSDVEVGKNRFEPGGTLLDLRGPFKNFIFAGTGPVNAVNLPALGTGFAKEYQGHYYVAGNHEGLLAPASPLLAAKLPDDPADAYADRFVTNWHPLKNKAGDYLSLGKRLEGLNVLQVQAETLNLAPRPLPNGIDPFLKPGTPRGWRTMIVDEWGPYDFKRPILRVKPMSDTATGLVLQLLGPKGSWKIKSSKGVKATLNSKVSPMEITLVRDSAIPDRNLTVTYNGAETVDYRGILCPKNTDIDVTWREFRAEADWDVNFYLWDPATQDPRKDDQAFRRNPILASEKFKNLDFAGYGRFAKGVPATHFATTAEAEIELPSGRYEFSIVADDGIRLYVDGELVIKDGWKYQGPTEYKTVFSGGKRKLRIEHFQIDGYASLKTKIRRL